MRAALAAVVTLLSLAGAARSQPAMRPEAAFQNARTTQYVAVLSVWRRSGGDDPWSYVFYRVTNLQSGEARWVVSASNLQGDRYRWADGATCRGLAEAAEFLRRPDAFLAPEVVINPTFGDGGVSLNLPLPSFAGAGAEYDARRRTPPTALETWADRVLHLLHPCWTNHVPG